jgi:hypothetical protein
VFTQLEAAMRNFLDSTEPPEAAVRAAEAALTAVKNDEARIKTVFEEGRADIQTAVEPAGADVREAVALVAARMAEHVAVILDEPVAVPAKAEHAAPARTVPPRTEHAGKGSSSPARGDQASGKKQ